MISDAELTRLIRKLAKQKWQVAADNLLIGNDTCCFTSERYVAELERVFNCQYIPDGGDKIRGARVILQDALQMVEVKPNVWAKPQRPLETAGIG